jgi:SAM-dependent methyltransferase
VESNRVKLVELVHERIIHPARVRNLTHGLGDLLARGASLLDVGCGDGFMAALLRDQCALSRVEGVDVLVRDKVDIPVTSFDGRNLPWPDRSWDFVMAVDVLHHVEDQQALLADMLRVARRAVVLKDHLCENAFDRWMLLKMDGVGNDRHGVAVPGRYLSCNQWQALIDSAGGKVETFRDHVPIYPWPLSMIFGRGLHCLWAISPTR